MHPFSRRLDDNDLIEHFLVRVLEYRPENLDEVIQRIKGGEFQIHHILDVDSTLGSTKHRRRRFAREEDRWNLRNQIVNELFSMQRTETDDEIEHDENVKHWDDYPKSKIPCDLEKNYKHIKLILIFSLLIPLA